ncbi:Squalene epoxidase [Coemansia sp. RSA 2322]|uniref:Squalene monooxygenase n=1 Tax=Coemansia thaxteri TaxID=2663907 RepID=A0A9W8BB20_9FUNG|nr:Squalene epoxidase [Coemansia thaxteri]KAJ2469738.1 Squalene epoxidase [Coemansia sp. RSA 2322]
MTVPLDENEDWPTLGQYEHSHLYHDRAAVRGFDQIASLASSYDFVVVGAGPIGAALAYKLSIDHPHRRLLVVERSWDEPDRIVGELMQPAGCQALEALGLRTVFSGIDAVPVHGYHIAYRGQQLYVPYPRKADGSRFRGVSFHHGRLVMNLRAACKSRRNITCLEASVGRLLMKDKETVYGVSISPPRGDVSDAAQQHTVSAGLTLVCDGISSQFRKTLNPEPVAMLSHFCGFVVEHEPADSARFFDGPEGANTHTMQAATPARENPLPMPHNGHVLLDGLGPVLLYQLTERHTRVLADLPGAALPPSDAALRAALRESLARAAPKHMYPGLHARLAAAVADPAQRIRAIGCRFVPAAANRFGGALWIGDALNVRHPLTGGGMTVGLADVALLCAHLRRAAPGDYGALSARAVRRAAARWSWDRRPRALVVNTLSVALHALFAAGDSPDLGLLRDACFRYLARGSLCNAHPAGFLSGLLPSPLLLVAHFFAVAALAMSLRLSGDPKAAHSGLLSLPARCLAALRTLWVAACVILPFMWKELQP